MSRFVSHPGIAFVMPANARFVRYERNYLPADIVLGLQHNSTCNIIKRTQSVLSSLRYIATSLAHRGYIRHLLTSLKESP